MTDTNVMADERETAQWYTCNSQSIEVQAVIETLTLADRRQCYQFGQLVNWHRLPAEVKDGLRRQFERMRLTSCYRCHARRAGDDGLCYACHDAGTAFGPRI
jgi:cytochrome c553